MSEPAALTLFGIPNCDQVKKARAWLAARSISIHFHDVKKTPLSSELLHAWIARTGWERLINRQGTTWRKLDPARQAALVDAASAVQLIQEHPSVMKRPVLQAADQIEIGFDAQRYESYLHAYLPSPGSND